MAEPQQPSSSHRQRVNPKTRAPIAADGSKSRLDWSSFANPDAMRGRLAGLEMISYTWYRA
jgi:hypothetical protein